jgi:hypothetical protein
MTPKQPRHFPAIRTLAVASVALLGMALPAGAAASSAAFTVHGTHGIALDVTSEHGTVTIVAHDRDPSLAGFSRSGTPRAAIEGNVSSSTYFAFGSAGDAGAIEAPLGRFGRISVSFEPSGKVRVTRPHASGPAVSFAARSSAGSAPSSARSGSGASTATPTSI